MYMRSIFVLLLLLLPELAIAQSFISSRIAFSDGRYRALDADLLNRDEHDFINGGMLDIEVGKVVFDKEVSLSMGGRIQYRYRQLKGIYTIDYWNADADINVHISSIYLTLGSKFSFSDHWGIIFKINLGPSYINWYEEGQLMDSYWRFYLPLDLELEYSVTNEISILTGVSAIPPIYLSSSTSIFLGLKKLF